MKKLNEINENNERVSMSNDYYTSNNEAVMNSFCAVY